MIALALMLVIAAPASDYALTCTAEGGADAFTLAFAVDGGKFGAIRLSDPQNVLDPLAKIMVYESSGGGGMSQHLPPKARLKFSGAAQGDGGFVFTSADRVMDLTLTLTPAPDGGFVWRSNGWRMMDRTMRGDLADKGNCVPGKGAATR